MILKWILVTSLVILVSFWHLHGSAISMESHSLHQELFVIPIIFAGFWFRLPAGIIVALIVSVIYLSSMIPHLSNQQILLTVFSQVALYIFIGALIGWLANRLHKQQLEMIKDQQRSSLVKLASALSFEIHEVIHSLEVKYKGKSLQSGETTDIDFKQEIERLKRLTNAFTQLDTPNSRNHISKDLNEIVKNTQRKYRQEASRSLISLNVELDNVGCPSMVISDTIIQLFEALVVNAIEASPKDSNIVLRTSRKGAYCLLEVEDNGPGVKNEDISKLFQPFFTTKEGGHGLSLAAGKKIMKDCEGDLLYEPGKNGGALFKMIVPRENRDKNIGEYISERALHPDK